MNKKLLSCLMALALIAVLAFSAFAVSPRANVADVLPPQEEVFSDVGGYGETLPEDETYVIERYDLTEDLINAENEEAEPESASIVKPLLICIVIGLVIALIVVLSVKSGYKPVHRKRDAAQYLVDGSLRVTVSNETLVRTDVSERTIETKNTNE